MRPKEVLVPNELWTSRLISEGAKLVWCFLRAACPDNEPQSMQQYTFGDLRQAVGICQNSLLKHLRELQAHNWLRWQKTGLRTLACVVIWPDSSAALSFPTDLLFDRRLSRAAKWVWGAIRQLGRAFDYPLLMQQTAYCHDSMTKYLRQLRETGWLAGAAVRVNRRSHFELRPVNPLELKRQAEGAELSRGMDLAKKQAGYSLGQYLAAHMVRLLAPGCMVIENAEVTGLENLDTGGRMHYDVLLPVHKLALEFHGPQHDGPTERFPSQEAYLAQRRRDLLKLGRSMEEGIQVIALRSEDLSFARLRQLLGSKIPLREEFGEQWHIYELLDRTAANYRKKAALRA